MGRFVRLPPARLFWLWLLNLYAALLVGLALANLASLPSAGAGVNVALRVRTPTLTATSTPPLMLTPTAILHPGAVSSADQSNTDSKALPAPSWLGEIVALAVFMVVGFGLIMFPLAVRSARMDNRTLPAYPLVPIAEKKLVARLSRVAPVRQEPLTREQLQALRDAARGNTAVSQQSSSLAAAYLVDGVPVSLPSSGVGTFAQLPAPRQPLVARVIESNAEEEAGEDLG